MNFNCWVEPQVVASMITGVATVIATVIAAITASVIGKNVRKNNDIKDELNTAIKDIKFLLLVEKEHCLNNKENDIDSRKNVVRDIVRNGIGMKFSGQFLLSTKEKS